MNSTNRFDFVAKLFFYLHHGFYKIMIFFECKKGKWTILLAEFLWIINALFKTKLEMSDSDSIFYCETKFGKYFSGKDLTNTIIVSPAFERNDKELLFKIIGNHLKKKRKVLFLDVGAHIGVYAVTLGDRFKRYKNLKIIAFEPDSDMFLMNSFALMKKNVVINNLRNISLNHYGLGNHEGINRIGVKVKKLDSVLTQKYINSYDVLFIKIDIEGHEINALKGAQNILKNTKNVELMVEDCVNPKIVTYLKKNKFTLINKVSPYNSFWCK